MNLNHKISTTTTRIDSGAQVALVKAQNAESLQAALSSLEEFYIPLKALVATQKFTGMAADPIIAATGSNAAKAVVPVIIAGIGSDSAAIADRLEYMRRAVARAIRAAQGYKVQSITIDARLAHEWFSDVERVAQELTIAAYLTLYHYDEYITTKDSTPSPEIIFWISDTQQNAFKAGVARGVTIGTAVNQARYWCDLPANRLTPTELAEQARRIAHASKLGLTIYTPTEIKAQGMGGLIAVSQGSAQECRFVVLEYDPIAHGVSVEGDVKTIALVGKGVTFDSGGLSIKPAARMDEMKDDMAGAASVIATMQAIAAFKPAIKIIGITPITENLPSGTAIKPGDIVTFYNGKTAEIKNTDAEGRLILADALAYAVKNYKPDAIFNIATLTGSCAYALGPFYCGMMSSFDDLVQKLYHASTHSGDRVWRLPFHVDYKKAVRSTVADICNIGNESYRAGAITAGFFLSHFVENTPWVHLDIAGTSFNVPDVAYYRPGATGFGVRLFLELLTHYDAY